MERPMEPSSWKPLQSRWWGVVALLATGLVAWRLLAADDAQTLRYAEHTQALADLRRPAGPGPHPALLLIHGGAWQGGSRRDMADFARWLASVGVASVAIDYRLTSGGARWPEIRDDVTQAMWWLREHAAELKLDPARIGVFGDSAGAHLGAWLATTDHVNARGTHSRPRLLIGWGGPWDLSREAEFHADVRPALRALLAGGDAAAASPLSRIDAQSAPTLLIHGALDDVIAPAQSRRACEALQRARIECQLLLPAGEGHVGLRVPANTAPVMDTMRRFIWTHLGR
jgi:acetyl esterase/lipase